MPALTRKWGAPACPPAPWRAGWLAAAWLGLALVVLLLPAGASAQEGNRAGLIVVHGDGRVVRQCVTFAEERISGYELLQRGNLPFSVEAGGFGATVCSIDGEGCNYPA